LKKFEIIDYYDDDLSFLGTIDKDEAHKIGAWHKSFHCWIVRKDNNSNFLLFQKRALSKNTASGYLDVTAGGHLITGEKTMDGIREIKEEIGLEIESKQLMFLGMKIDVFKFPNIWNREFCDVFLLRNDTDIRNYVLNKKEVCGIVQININEGLDLFTNRVSQIKAASYEFDNSQRETKIINNIEVSIKSFAPRLDNYYAKMLMIAKAYFNGERDLYI
jgi:isopentenyldiphosphate isomerase